MRKLYFIIIACLLSIAAKAQTASSYGFTATSGSFSSIASSGTATTSFSYDDATETSINIGFNFDFCGATYNSLSACSNGWLSLANTSDYGWSNDNTVVDYYAFPTPGAGLLMAFWDDLDGSGYTAYYTTTGTAPNRVFTFEWENWGNVTGSGNANIQIKLYETTNVIEYLYGSSSYSGNSATIGIANSTSDFLTLNSPSASPTPSATVFNMSLSSLPSSGVLYRWTPPAPCSGTPTAGAALSSTATACPATSFLVSLTGTTAATGLAYQWQSSSDSISWSSISGETNSTASLTESAPTYFRCIVTCTSASASDTSSLVYVGYIGACYCIPSYSSAYWACAVYNLAITSYQINGESGTSINDAATCTSTGYQDFTATSVSLMQGAAYTTTISNGGTVNYSNAQAWIDYNDDGTFDATESVGGATSFLTTTYTTLVSASAPVGAHRMRVLLVFDGEGFAYPTLDPCAYGYTYGEARDYTVNIVAMPPCSGTPTPGTVAATGAPACPSSTIGLSLVGASVATGLTYQWESSADSSTWTSITGATNATLSTTESAATYFRCVITCTTSSATVYTPGLLIPYWPACYCTTPAWYSESSYTGGYAMDALDITGHSGSTLNDAAMISATPSSGYLDRLAMTPLDLQQGGTYTGSVSYGTTSSYMETQAWIDYNDNGTFENTELIINPVAGFSASTSTGGTAITLHLPITATPGAHRMRVRCAWLQTSTYTGSVSNPMDPCAMCDAEVCYWSGNVVDYIVNVVALPACTGTPTAGTVSVAGAPACPSSTFTLSLSGSTMASGLTYSWESSADSSTWTAISGATSATLTTSETAATYFRCIVTCAASSSSDTTAGVLVTYIAACYCTPYYSSSSSACSMYNLYIADFHINGESSTAINDAAPCTGSGYQDFTALSVSLMQGAAYTTTISNSGTVNYANAQAWIDYNNDGTFDATESVGGATSFLTTTYTTLLSATAPTGAHRMRVVLVFDGEGYAYPTMDPCTYGYIYGEVRDYTVNIVPMPPCSGTPTAGTVAATGIPACPSSTIGLSLTGATVAAGLTYQWQSSADSSSWTSITGATDATFSTTESAATYFRCVITCTTSAATVYTPGLLIPYWPACYCTTPAWYSESSYSSGYAMDALDITGHSGSTLNDAAMISATPSSGYLDRLAMTPLDLQQGGTYTGSVSYGTTSSYMETQAWIDYNDNGTFENTELIINPVAGFSASTATGGTAITLNLPVTATPGIHRMRFRCAWLQTSTYTGSVSNPMDPCAMCDAEVCYWSGNVVDYIVNVVALPACTGTPTAGTVSVIGAPACPSSTITLSLSGATMATGLTYSWESSADSSTWTAISGATDATLSTTETASTYYRCVITCAASSGTAYTPGVLVRYISACYCTPSYATAGLSCSLYSVIIANFHVDGEAGTSINDAAPCTGTGYQNFTALSVTLMQSLSYTTTISNGGTVNYSNAQVWIDFDDDGTFATSESVGGATSYLTTTFTMTIPASAAAGAHRMRVVTVYDGEGYAYPTMDPCTYGYTYGESRDYTANIIALPACTGTPTPGTVLVTGAPACPSSTINLSLSGATIAAGITYQWQSSADSSSWTNITGATNATFSTTETASTYYRCVLVCTTSTGTASTPGVLVRYISACYCIPSYYSASSACSMYNLYIANYHIDGVSSTSINDATGCTGSGYQDLTHMYVSLMQGGTYTTTISNGGTVNYAEAQAWVDFNDNGTFESSESVGGASSFLTTTFTTTIPATASTGTHRMRVVMVFDGEGFYYSSLDPCTYGYTYGEARDYTVNIITTACTGTPTAGTISTSTAWACTAFSPTLTATGYTTGVSNFTQWQVSSDSTTWSGVSGATSATYSPAITGGVVYYRFMDSCTSSGLAAYTAGIRLSLYSLPVTGAITGPSSVCAGSTITLADTTAGGTWTSSSTTLATVSTSGIVTGIAAGVDTIRYAVTNICGTTTVTRTITILALPAAGTLSGSGTVCAGSTISITPTVTGGSWSVTNTRASVLGGTVTGITAGTDTVLYTVTNSCGSSVAMHIITVNPLPFAGTITGVSAVCLGLTTTLADTASGGTWSTTNTRATVSTTGVVTGVSLGMDTVVYTVSNACGTATTSFAISVSNAPYAGALSGPASVCEASAISLTTTITGGTWSVANGHASVTGGTVTGVSAGVDTVYYTVATSCGTASAIHIVTVNPLPVTGTLSTTTSPVCERSTATITTTGVTGGTWSAYPVAVGTINASTGVLTGTGGGTVTITYTVANSCGTSISTYTVVVTPLPHTGYLSGPSTVCEGAYITLSPGSGGGSWFASNTNATVSGGTVGGVTAGVDTIIYVLTNGCGSDTASRMIAVDPLPVPGTLSAATTSICAGDSVTYTSSVSGGTWTTGSALIATVSATGSVHAVGAGTSYVYYTLTNLCGSRSASMPVTVNALPNAGTITGSSLVCAGRTTSLSTTGGMSGGTWSSSSATLASVDMYGTVFGYTSGSVTISYTVSNSCGSSTATHAITVNPLPFAGTISGPAAVCSGANITLSRSGGTSTGNWYSLVPSIAGVGATTGIVTGGTPGTTTILYVVSGPCGDDTAYYTMTVNALPAAGSITGPTTVCEGATITLSNPTGTAGGVWTSTNTARATVSTAGIVTGVGAGTVTISYTAVTTSCGTAATSRSLTVNPAPRAGVITGASQLCPGTTITLTDTASGGSWSSTNIHTTHAGGAVSGVTVGADTLSYTVTNSCGTAVARHAVAVLPIPTGGTISGPTSVCAGGGVITLANTEAGGTWSASSGIATVNPSTGDVTGLTAGTVRISYTFTNICGSGMTSQTITVTPLLLPAVTASASPGTSVCDGTVVNFTANPVNGGALPAYIWYKGTTYMGTGTTMGYVPANGDVITVRMTSTANCIVTPTVTSPAYTIATGPEVTPGVFITASPNDSAAFIGQVINFTATAVNGGTMPAFAWYLDGALQAGATSSTYSQAFYSNHTVYCELTSNAPCVTAATVPSNLMSIFADYLTVKNTGNALTGLQLYPNPNEGSFTVTGTVTGNEEITYNVTDVTGRVLMTGTLQPENGMLKAVIKMDGSITAGQYQIRFTAEGINQVMQFVKMN